MVLRKRFMSEPDGNLYRGWAVGMTALTPQLVGLTVLVMIAQVVAPVISLLWARKQLQDQRAVHLWSPASSPSEAVDWGEEVMRKFLGTVLTTLVFINGDNRLKRMDFQRERLRDLYPHIRVGWMVADAFCNSWCVAVCALAVFPLVWASDDVNDIILDVFGFLFLQSLDDYSSIIDYGIEQSDFDKVIHARGVEVDTRTRWVYEDGHYLRQAQNTEETSRPHWLTVRFHHGDAFYSLGRIVNCIAFCFGWPAYISVKWITEKPLEDNWFSEIVNARTCSVGCLLLCTGLLNNLCWYIVHRQQGQRDFCSFFYQVFLLRPDPREVRQIQADIFGSAAGAARPSSSSLRAPRHPLLGPAEATR